MLHKKNVNGIVIGAAIGTLLGSMSALLLPKPPSFSKRFRNQTQGWLDKARDVSENVLDEVKNFRDNRKSSLETNYFSKGALLGLAIGASAALLLSPRTGKQLRKDLKQRYQDISQKTEDFIHIFDNNSHPKLKKVRKALKKRASLAKSHGSHRR